MIPLAVLTAAALALGAAALIPNRLPETARLLVIAVIVTAVVLLWPAVRSFEGWPVHVGTPPEGAVFVAAAVHEPDSIYLWLVPPGTTRPRGYRLPYSDDLYKQIIQAQRQTKAGHPVAVKRTHGRRGQEHRKGDLAFGFRRYRLPPLILPRKPTG